MFRLFDQWTPSFLKRLDKKLLLENPTLWATKIHYAIPLIALYALGVMGSAFFVEVSTKSLPNNEQQIVFWLIPAAIGLLGWAWSLSQHNVEKLFGEYPKAAQTRNTFLIGAALGAVIITPFLGLGIVHERTSYLKSNKQLSEDIHTLNAGAYFFSGEEEDPDAEHLFTKFTVYSSYRTEAMTSTDVAKVRKEVKAALGKEEKEIALVEKFLKVFQEYEKRPLNVSAENIISAFHNKDQSYAYAEPFNDFYEVGNRINKIAEAKEAYQATDYKTRDLMGFGTLSVMALIFLLSFLKTSLRQMLITVAMGFLLFVVGGFSGVMMDEIFGGRDEFYFSMLFAGGYAFLALFGMFGPRTQRMGIIKQSALILVAFFTPILPIALAEGTSHTSTNDTIIFLLVGSCLGLFAWISIYNGRLTKLFSEPTID